MIARAFALTSLLATSACVIEPYNGKHIGPTETFTVTGYTDVASAVVVIEAYDWDHDQWEEIGRTTADSFASFGAGAWGSNSPALYAYSATVQIADSAEPDSFDRWAGASDGYAHLRVRNETNGTTLTGGDHDSLSCFLSAITPSSSFHTTAYNCGFSSTEIWVYYIG